MSSPLRSCGNSKLLVNRYLNVQHVGRTIYTREICGDIWLRNVARNQCFSVHLVHTDQSKNLILKHTLNINIHNTKFLYVIVFVTLSLLSFHCYPLAQSSIKLVLILFLLVNWPMFGVKFSVACSLYKIWLVILSLNATFAHVHTLACAHAYTQKV